MGIDRRDFLKKGALASGGLFLSGLWKNSPAFGKGVSDARKLPAVLGGEKAHPGSWPKWPKWKGTAWDEKMIAVLRSGVWSRAKYTEQFESEWARMVGVKRCLSTVNGTNALIVALNQAGIGIGDEVIVTPYTFVASVQAILLNGAIPVFADIDRNTFQIDPEKIREKITSRTKAILPVHILGIPADMDRIMAIAREHHLVVIEMPVRPIWPNMMASVSAASVLRVASVSRTPRTFRSEKVERSSVMTTTSWTAATLTTTWAFLPGHRREA